MGNALSFSHCFSNDLLAFDTIFTVRLQSPTRNLARETTLFPSVSLPALLRPGNGRSPILFPKHGPPFAAMVSTSRVAGFPHFGQVVFLNST